MTEQTELEKKRAVVIRTETLIEGLSQVASGGCVQILRTQRLALEADNATLRGRIACLEGQVARYEKSLNRLAALGGQPPIFAGQPAWVQDRRPPGVQTPEDRLPPRVHRDSTVHPNGMVSLQNVTEGLEAERIAFDAELAEEQSTMAEVLGARSDKALADVQRLWKSEAVTSFVQRVLARLRPAKKEDSWKDPVDLY